MYPNALRHRVVARTSPGVATQDAADGQVQSFEGAVLADGFDGILRAGGGEAARGAQHGRDAALVEVDGHEQQPRQQTFHGRASGEDVAAGATVSAMRARAPFMRSSSKAVSISLSAR